MNNLYNFKSNVSDTATLLTWDEIQKKKLDPKENYFVSVFRYNDAHKKILRETNSIKGIRDTVTNQLLWDFDSTDLEAARQEALALCIRLNEEYNIDAEDIEVAFSGGKGFHVSVRLQEEITAEQFKKAVTTIGADLNFDTTVTHANCLIRVMNTVNQKTGLYKIPLLPEELSDMSIEDIKKLARTPRELELEYKTVILPLSLFEVKEKKKLEAVADLSEFDYSQPPKGWKLYKWVLAQGWFEASERHNALLIIAATCRGLGYDKTTTYFVCKSAIEKQAKRTGTEKFPKEELFENIVESVFSNNWDGGQFGIDNPLVQKICKRLGIDLTKESDNIVQLHNIEDEFIDYVKNIDKNTILTGIAELDEKLPLTVGMNLGIIGAASSGKTALALKILENTSNAGVISVFASLDMRRNRLYEKLLYRVSGLNRSELYQKIQNNEAQPIFDLVREKYANVYFYDRSCPSVDDIRNYITSIEERTGKKVKLVMVDYFERVNAERSDETAASKEVSGKLQDLVNDFNICLITLVQPNKFSLSGGPDTPILSYTSIKGSSFLYQSFRSIISIWRPFFTPELKNDDKYLQMAILKNDLGELDMLNFGWNGKRGEIWGLGEEGQEELERLLDEKEDRKNKKDDSGGWE